MASTASRSSSVAGRTSTLIAGKRSTRAGGFLLPDVATYRRSSRPAHAYNCCFLLRMPAGTTQHTHSEVTVKRIGKPLPPRRCPPEVSLRTTVFASAIVCLTSAQALAQEAAPPAPPPDPPAVAWVPESETRPAMKPAETVPE